jgi:type VI secretion system protein ImpF
MADAFSRDRLQPALLDRLIDDAPHERAEAPDERTITRQRLRQSVLRDLQWLFNATTTFDLEHTGGGLDHVRRSTLNYGFPPLAGTLASKVRLSDLERMVRQAIIDFEPRILPESLQVRAVPSSDPMGHHSVLEVEIAGRLWAQPYPVELLLRTALHLESGLVEIREGGVPMRDTAVRR